MQPHDARSWRRFSPDPDRSVPELSPRGLHRQARTRRQAGAATLVTVRPVERGPSPPFRVLLVCTANHCRSPLAEHLFNASAQLRDAGWSVVSAGIHAVDGQPMHRLSDQVLRERGIDPSGWTSRHVTPHLVNRADLVLAVDSAVRRQLVVAMPVALRRTFVLGQFANLAAAVGPLPVGPPREVGHDLIKRVEAARGNRAALPASAFDLSDPVGRRIGRFRRTADLVSRDRGALERAYLGRPAART